MSATITKASAAKAMTAKRGNLELIPNGRALVHDHQSRVAAQAIVEGMQDISVSAATPLAGPTKHGQIAVRVGRLLVYVNDREALASFVDALQQAGALADKAFGMVEPVLYRRSP